MRVLGIDYGERRIGIAVSDPTGTIARPVGTIAGSPNQAGAVTRVMEELAALERDDDPVGLVVVGLPSRLDGSANEQTPRVRAFAALLSARSGRSVVLQDERLTSHEADRLLAMREPDWRVRKQRLDAAAAAVILQEYLDGHRDSGVGIRDSDASSSEHTSPEAAPRTEPSLDDARDGPEPCEWGKSKGPTASVCKTCREGQRRAGGEGPQDVRSASSPGKARFAGERERGRGGKRRLARNGDS